MGLTIAFYVTWKMYSAVGAIHESPWAEQELPLHKHISSFTSDAKGVMIIGSI